MIDIKDISASERLKPLIESLKIEMAMLDAEKQRIEFRIQTLIKEIDLAILEL